MNQAELVLVVGDMFIPIDAQIFLNNLKIF